MPLSGQENSKGRYDMKKNLMLGYTPQQIYEVLWKEFNKNYIGEGLYVSIESITIEEPTIKEHNPPYDFTPLNCCRVAGECGRYIKDNPKENNFKEDFSFEFYEGDTLDYIAGKFATTIS